MFLIDPYLKPGDPFASEPRNTLAAIRRGYAFKYHAAALIQAQQERPLSILEIGVRAGYSAAAFLAASPAAVYVGLDADNAEHGGERGYSDWARLMLCEKFPDASIDIRRCDTRRDPWPVPPGRGEASRRFDLVHVDGDHSETGCLDDLTRAMHLARWILVDDLDHLPDVLRATAQFLFHQRCEFIRCATFRGDCLIRVT